MTDEPEEKPGSKRAGRGGGIIDAAARTRPRIHSAESAGREAEELAFLGDVPLQLNVVLGETRMPLGEIIALETDSIVQLDKLSGEPIDIYVGNQKLGKGEVIVLHEKLRVRVIEVTSPSSEMEEPNTYRQKEKQEG